jgi:hypothetical protein
MLPTKGEITDEIESGAMTINKEECGQINGCLID